MASLISLRGVWVGYWLVVFKSRFVEEDEHSMLDSNGVKVFDGIFNGGH